MTFLDHAVLEAEKMRKQDEDEDYDPDTDTLPPISRMNQEQLKFVYHVIMPKRRVKMLEH